MALATIIAAVTGLVTAVASLVRATKGDRDHNENAARIAAHAARIESLEGSAERTKP